MPRFALKYRDEARKQVPYLVDMETNRYYGRVKSSTKKMSDADLLALIKQEISKRGFYDPELLDSRSTVDIS